MSLLVVGKSSAMIMTCVVQYDLIMILIWYIRIELWLWSG